MLPHTFCHLPKIGLKKELSLWRGGVVTWDSFRCERLSEPRREATRRGIEESSAALAAGDARYFHRVLPPGEQWRLYGTFRERACYLDIETTGMQGHPGDHLTTIALYDGVEVRTYVHGRNLEAFADDIAGFSLIVTYNGKTFDVPYLERALGVRLPQAHLDLRYPLAKLGFKGGLKGCEKQLGLARGDTEGLDGYFAVLLWQEYRRTRDERALETLLAYNADDVLNLEALATIVYNRCVLQTPFSDSLALPETPPAANPFTTDPRVVDRLMGQYRRVIWR